MRKKLLIIFSIGCLMSNLSILAQENELDCKINLNEAIAYLKGGEFVKRDTLKAIKYLKPCAESGNSKAQLLLGRIYLRSYDKKSIKKGFQQIKKAAKRGNVLAATDLGILFKYGRGCKTNLNKSKYWFEKASLLGDEKAIYSLGYMYFKGLGSVNQNYDKAVELFKKSNYNMAKYWLGICYYNGYGVTKDLNKSYELIKESNFFGSEINDSFNENVTKISDEYKLYQEVIAFKNSEPNLDKTKPIGDFKESKLKGKWSGNLVQFDWSNSKVINIIPLSTEFKFNSEGEIESYSLNIAEQDIKSLLSKVENTLIFDDLNVNLGHYLIDNKSVNNISYEIESGDFSISFFNNKEYLVGDIVSKLSLWKEPSSPLYFVLTKDDELSEKGEVISGDIINALNNQEDKFIRLYPNPFESEFYIAYNLEKEGVISVNISSLDGTYQSTLEKGKKQMPGNYKYYFDGTILKNGIYAISVYVDGEKKNELIIKE